MRVLRSKRAIVLAAVALVAVGVTAAVALAVLPRHPQRAGTYSRTGRHLLERGGVQSRGG